MAIRGTTSTTYATTSITSATTLDASTFKIYSGTGHQQHIPRVHNKYHDTAPKDAVNIMRGSPWGNPFSIGNGATRELVIARFEREILPNLDLTPLIGRHLVCCCKPKECHGDKIMRELRRLEREKGVFHG